MPSTRRVELSSAGLVLDGEVVPLLSGSVHYFRLARSTWRPALEELKRLGARLVDLYVPWGVHEKGPGIFDFGRTDPRLDVAEFLKIASEVGLYAIVRPGPHINSELTFFGIPERVIWNDACQARSASGARVFLPLVPLGFPVPSYASRAFHEEAATWLGAVGRELAPFAWPDGPVVLAQIDNEGAQYFRDGPYDQDYHPDAVGQYRRFLKQKYKSDGALRAAHEDTTVSIATIAPPASFRAETTDGVARHTDWAEFQEALIESALYRFRVALQKGGLDAVPTFHNLPIAESATPLDALRIERAVDFTALDYYHHASEKTRREIARRTSTLATRARLHDKPAFAAEMAAGFAPYFPPLAERDNAFSVLAALAYGLRGFNAYMAVTRDRWIGGPIDARGRPRPSAEFWRKLFAAFERTRFHELERRAAVHVLVPKSFERLVRVFHAFGAAPPTAFAFGGEGAERGGLEGRDDPTSGAFLETERFFRTVSALLDQARAPYAVVDESVVRSPSNVAAWTIVLCPGAMDPELVALLAERMQRGARISVGPFLPDKNAALGPLGSRLPKFGPPIVTELPQDRAALSDAIERALQAGGVERFAAEPAGVHTTLHVDAQGKPRVLFVLNPTEAAVEVVASVPGVRAATDALDLENVLVTGEHVVLPVEPLSVRMLDLAPTSTS